MNPEIIVSSEEIEVDFLAIENLIFSAKVESRVASNHNYRVGEVSVLSDESQQEA